ncbi:hypothetical protein ACP275_08G152200 [Erythranthe tilingii]
MAEEFQWSNCGGGNWWDSLRNLFFSPPKVNDLVSLRQPLNHHRTITANPVDDEPAGSDSDGTASVLPMRGIRCSSSRISEDCSRDLLHDDSGRSDSQNTNFCDDSSINSVANLRLDSASSSSYSYTSSLLQNSFDTDSQPQLTALHQLISPFGKTDEASVLYETIGYIKFLQNQISVLSSPYSENGGPSMQRRQTSDEIIKNEERLIHELRSQGLCLVPISTTFPLAVETIFEQMMVCRHVYEGKRK